MKCPSQCHFLDATEFKDLADYSLLDLVKAIASKPRPA
jgi:hypothetical protein